MDRMQQSLRKPNTTSRRGQALVESVLTLVAFLALFMGMIEVGEILFVHQTLAERTRTAVRWAAVNTWDDTNTPPLVTNLVLYGTTSPAQNAQPFMGLSSSNVSVTRPQPDFSAADRIVVTVSGYALTFLTNAMVQGQTAPNANAQFTGLTISESVPYEVTNGSSH
jgi:TadE-like protein